MGSRPDLYPTTLAGKLDHLTEEMEEVLQAVGKLRRFGPKATDERTGKIYLNWVTLLAELGDLKGAIDRVEHHRANPGDDPGTPR